MSSGCAFCIIMHWLTKPRNAFTSLASNLSPHELLCAPLLNFHSSDINYLGRCFFSCFSWRTVTTFANMSNSIAYIASWLSLWLWTCSWVFAIYKTVRMKWLAFVVEERILDFPWLPCVCRMMSSLFSKCFKQQRSSGGEAGAWTQFLSLLADVE